MPLSAKLTMEELVKLQGHLSRASEDLREISEEVGGGISGRLRMIRQNDVTAAEGMVLSFIERARGGTLPEGVIASFGARPGDKKLAAAGLGPDGKPLAKRRPK
jgi:hypothetical protein